MPDHPASSLAALAQTALHHAAAVHGTPITLTSAALAAVDRILANEATGGVPAQRESLAACYGAWLGEIAVRELGAAWIALHEPVAPRLRIGGTVASPIDAVRRRLGAPTAGPTLVEVFTLLRTWAAEVPVPERADVLERNRAAWAALAQHPRFIGDDPPGDPATALVALDPWLIAEGVAGKDVLCLAAGGGRHGPLLARAGARVTVVDLSEEQLAHDRRMATTRGLTLRTLAASLDDLRALADASFAIVVQPVSACYLPELDRMHAEVARVLRPGGLYLVQHKQPASLQAGIAPAGGGYPLEQPYVEGSALPAVAGAIQREAGTAEFLHTLDALLGGLCRAGFVIEDLHEPQMADALAPIGSAEHRACVLPPYLKLKARRR